MKENVKMIRDMSEIQSSCVCCWEQNDEWWLYIPKCGVGRLPLHQVTQDIANGQITVTPSILMTGHDNGQPTLKHGYITNGIWEEV